MKHEIEEPQQPEPKGWQKIITKPLEVLYEILPESYQSHIMKAMESIFYSYYSIKHSIPFNKARLRLAYHEKYLPSDEYRQMAIDQNPHAASDFFFSERLWPRYIAQLTTMERIQCIFIPYTIIDRYER